MAPSFPEAEGICTPSRGHMVPRGRGTVLTQCQGVGTAAPREGELVQTGGAASHVREEGAGSPAGHIRAETGQRPSAMGSSGAAVRTADQTQHSAQPHRRPRGGLGQLPCRYPRARSAGGPWEILVPGDVQRLTWVAGELSAAHVGLYPGREGSVDTRAPRGLYGHESPVWSTDTRAPCGLRTREPRVRRASHGSQSP